MILAVSRNPLISITRHVWVVLGRSRDQVGTKLGLSRGDTTGEVTGEVRRCCEAKVDAAKHHETRPVTSLPIGCSQ